ncbi:hypothetical protein GIB67_041544, partial [Kingdonia uniflora]
MKLVTAYLPILVFQFMFIVALYPHLSDDLLLPATFLVSGFPRFFFEKPLLIQQKWALPISSVVRRLVELRILVVKPCPLQYR